ncbi:hypothetical protein J4416_03710 [Candidatus Pacearchaeota archaeon]|nr:hypothetical protein [Candidatus Pacearchaeota archaeon]
MSRRKELEAKALGNLLDSYVSGETPRVEDIGFSSPKPWGFYRNIENILNEARKIMERENWVNLPGGNVLRERGYHSLVNGINKYSSYPEVRRILGLEQSRDVSGNWSNQDFIIKEARKIMEREGYKTLPSKHELRKKGYKIFVSRIHNNFGFRKFRELLGEEQRKIANGFYEDVDNALAEARRIMEKECWDELPGGNILRKKGYSSLSNGITNNYGFRKFRRLLGGKQKNIEWSNEEVAFGETERILKTEGWEELPTRDILAKRGYFALIAGIKRNYGFLQFRQMLKQRITERSETQQLSSLLETYVQGEKDNE